MSSIEDLEARIISRVYAKGATYAHVGNILHLLRSRTEEVGHDQAVMDIWKMVEETT